MLHLAVSNTKNFESGLFLLLLVFTPYSLCEPRCNIASQEGAEPPHLGHPHELSPRLVRGEQLHSPGIGINLDDIKSVRKYLTDFDCIKTIGNS